jgi:hypothetical protein
MPRSLTCKCQSTERTHDRRHADMRMFHAFAEDAGYLTAYHARFAGLSVIPPL